MEPGLGAAAGTVKTRGSGDAVVVVAAPALVVGR